MWIDREQVKSSMYLNDSLIHARKYQWQFLVCSSVLLLVLSYGVYKEINRINQLVRISKNGILTNAIITDKDSIYHRYISDYFLYYKFTTNLEFGAKEYESYSLVKKGVYRDQKIGNTIKVTFNQNNPVESSYGDLTNISLQDLLKYNLVYYVLFILIFFIAVTVCTFQVLDIVKCMINRKLNQEVD